MSSRRASGGKMPASPMRSYSSTVKECLAISTDIFLLFLFGPYPALGSGLLDYLLRDVSGDGVVVRELHVEGAAGGGDGVELGLIIEHLGHRNLRLDDLVLAAHVHALHATAARVEVAHNVAARLDGRDHLDVHYRFEYGRLHFLDGVAEGLAS